MPTSTANTSTLFGRSVRNKNKSSHRSPRMSKKKQEVEEAPERASRMLQLSSAVSLDGQSLQLPEDYSHNMGASALLGLNMTPSLDGESLLLPEDGRTNYNNFYSSRDYDQDEDDDDDDEDDSTERRHGATSPDDVDFQDDVSSINDESIAHPGRQHLKIVDSGDLTQPTSPPTLRSGETLSASNNKKQPATPSKIAFAKPSDAADLEASKNETDGCCCFPVWIKRAPTWLKVLLVLCVGILIAAMGLVVYGLTVAVQNQNQSSSSSASTNAGVTTPTNTSTGRPVNNRTDDQNKPKPPKTNDTVVPTNLSSIVAFYVTGGSYSETVQTNLPALLSSLPNSIYLPTNTTNMATFNMTEDDLFMVHLGDWNTPSVSGCELQEYSGVASEFQSSAVPVYFVVGDNEYNDCSDQEAALGYWRDNLVDYETQFWAQPSWTIARDVNREENFAFVHKQVIFVGINLVAGSIVSSDEWVGRLQDNLDWIDTQIGLYGGQAKAVTIFCHSSPDHAQNVEFFTELLSRIQNTYTSLHFVLVHRNTPTQTANLERQFNDISNLDMVTVQGSSWPPMKVVIDVDDKKNGVKTLVDQTFWYENYRAAVDGGGAGAVAAGGQLRLR